MRPLLERNSKFWKYSPVTTIIIPPTRQPASMYIIYI